MTCILALGPTAPATAAGRDMRAGRPEGISGLGVQFTDKLLQTPDWRGKVDLAAKLGASFVRIDLNWPWTETEADRYDWSLYDDFAAELKRRGLRPLFILNRPNEVHGRPYVANADGNREVGIAPPRSATEIAAFARWAAMASLHFKSVDPVWEIWNEPDGAGFWPPRPDPAEYVRLARATCAAIKKAVPTAFVTGPAAAQMPTIWDAKKPLLAAVMSDPELTQCLDAVSLHTHRFGQAPETVSRDYAIFRRQVAELPGKTLPILDTEWGDAVHRRGVSEAQQARWLTRMVLTNLVENVNLTNWYCLFDTGDDDSEIEDRFGLVARDGRPRPAYRAYQTLARELHGYVLRQVVARFDPATVRGKTILLFCDPRQRCKLVAWSTEDAVEPLRTTIPGWVLAGPIIGHLGQNLAITQQEKSSISLKITSEVQFAAVQSVQVKAE